MKSTNINTLINGLLDNVERYCTVAGAMATSFEAVLKASGIKVKYDKEGNVSTNATKAQKNKLAELLRNAVEKKFGDARSGKGKSASNALSRLRGEYGLSVGSNTTAGKSKYSKAMYTKTAEFIKRAFKMDDEELRKFIGSMYQALNKNK